MSKYSSRDLIVKVVSKNDTLIFKDVHMEIEATKTKSAIPNSAIIKIFNLKATTREFLSKNIYDFKTNKGFLKIEVILDDFMIFTGEIINTIHQRARSEGEYVSILYCGDGANALNTKVNKTYNKGLTRENVIDDLKETLKEVSGITGDYKDILNKCTKDKSLLKKITIDGKIIDNIQKLLDECLPTSEKQEVYISDGKIVIKKVNSIIPNSNIIINKNLLAPPTLTEQGVSCEIAINPNLVIGGEFELKTNNFNTQIAQLTQYRVSRSRLTGEGKYQVIEIKHKVDNYSDQVASTSIIGLSPRITL